MIGVVCQTGQEPWVAEFFELFKTPWEFYRPDAAYPVVISTIGRPQNLRAELFISYGEGSAAPEWRGAKIPIYGKASQSGSRSDASDTSGLKVIRAGFDLFEEVEFLLSSGQPEENASIPTLEIHIAMLREWILDAGIPVVEIPPAPPGYDFIGCLTHDVDFIRITDHKFDHTMLGFVQRASIGSLSGAVRGETSWGHCFENMKALASLPAVYCGLREDFWLQDFDRFMELERDMKATFFFIPFKDRAGDNVNRPHSERRAAAYNVADEGELLRKLVSAGNEIGVHGIDAWHSVQKGRDEYSRVAETSGEKNLGIRMHWLCFDESSPEVLDKAGFDYDSSCGFNATVGYRAGTHQVFRPRGAKRLLELPMHIQDTALFYPGRFRANDERAFKVCERLIENASAYGGALTLLWHTRSMAPERQWGDFYVRLLDRIKERRVWWGTASEVVDWFRQRRAVSFQSVEVSDHGVRVSLAQSDSKMAPNITIRIHTPNKSVRDVTWTGQPVMLAASVAESRR